MPADDRPEAENKAGDNVRALRWLGVILLALLTLALAVLTLGSFASLNPNAPLWLRTLGGVETLLSRQAGAGQVPGFARAALLTLLTSLLAGLVAFLKPRA
ncbi:hypothetical protein E5F05_14010 [Deinococcus metallilatus]|uniref:Uncharacterized protein n=1 Tax=Deinococcus metallilatus TaxID=1211322 RepID=A0AAJ5F904_9DEIO|nr:hypothetical protein [Deinococcus metallilatus]MBB5294183.1 hypothetical protein [Deinococcus metallilatus]QBY08962.1 hypothetical protein E5F05_14010 [Deinococcus metallilatus]RXJ10106.1 hypothetical protein ERJ73_12840 [Deinococcus metallilatus]TLK27957.1 hypothetical protein FCS05_08540 [Deinococcus metallilatus]GMA16480.1 hypothetical protein GCM10025871_28110 [Deinococcus metallilatus]